MTNKDKFLRDGVSVEEFARAIVEFKANNLVSRQIIEHEIQEIVKWLNSEPKPTLTEDERVILEFIANFDYIGRNEKGLYYKLQDADIKEKTAVIYTPTTNLFQFIKERRRILY